MVSKKSTIQREMREWVKSSVKKPGKTQVGLAKALGIDKMQISRLLQGKRRIQADEIATIENYIGENCPVILSGEPFSSSAEIDDIKKIVGLWMAVGCEASHGKDSQESNLISR